MGKKFRLIGISGKTLNNTIENSILSFVNNMHAKSGELSRQQKIIDSIRRDFKISDGKIRLVLEDLVKRRKLSTVYDKPNRYYGPPKIPLPIKMCTAMITVILSIYLLIDIIVPKEYLRNIIYLSKPIGDQNIPHLNIFPFAIIGIVTTITICLFWYLDHRKVFK